ncbi:Signaling lymphocytic activation molecule family member 1 [Pelobates cultripes]|uniref:Signaling lymphocytic activation molecule family member 1 n=1 Tax=Pelobates cultripes TaxID=61616 RepID=A0AAD1TL70_PELCU|nr:Signaling lymphocytic activation molecule family member 1 [Pelobates cultripes]
MTGNGTCGGILLCVTNRTDVTIAWSSSDGSEINVTNGFLHFASIVTNTIYNCTAQNPVSAIYKTVNLSEYCEKEEESLPLPRDALNDDIYIYIPIPVILCVALFALIINRRLNRRKRAIKEEYKTEVPNSAAERVNAYQLDSGPEFMRTAVNTVYSAVESPKVQKSTTTYVNKYELDSRPELIRTAMNTIYSSAESPEKQPRECVYPNELNKWPNHATVAGISVYGEVKCPKKPQRIKEELNTCTVYISAQK